MTALKLDQVESALARAWDDAQGGEGAPPARLRTVNLVAICNGPGEEARVRQAVDALLPGHPGRAIIAVIAPDGAAGITADATLSNAGRGQHASEVVTLAVRGARARGWVPNAIERLLSPGVPVFLWWVGDLADDDTLYDQLTQPADVIAVNSAAMDLRDLGTLWRLARDARSRYALADLGWLRLRWWQELLARFFDDPAVRPRLAGVRVLSICASPHRTDVFDEPTSTQAGLFAGWFASRVGASTEHPRWTTPSGATREVVLPRASGMGTLAIRFRTETASEMPNGALLRVRIETDDGAVFEVARQEDDPFVLGWKGESAGAVIPPAVVRVRRLEETELLARWLQSPLRDALFETSLRAAAGIIAPIHPRLSRP